MPIFNEAACIEASLNHLVNEFEKERIDYELILVNHGSSDDSDTILERIARDNERIKPVNLEKNLGFGGGVNYGLDLATGEYIGFTCIDEQVSASDTCRVFHEMKKGGFDAVKAIRTGRKDGRVRTFTSMVFNGLTSLLFGVGVTDVNGYPLIFKKAIYDQIRTDETGYLFNLDIVRNIWKGIFSPLEVTVVHQVRGGGKSFMKPLRMLQMVLQLLRYSVRRTSNTRRPPTS